MATNPTRRQQQACDHLAEALFLVTEAARLDDPGRLDQKGLEALADRLAGVSAAFDRDVIVARALTRRCAAAGLRADAAELLTLLDAEMSPLQMLRLDDEALRDLVTRLEQELGEVE